MHWPRPIAPCFVSNARSLGPKLPGKQTKTGAAVRERVQRLGLFRDSGHEHFRGSITVPIPAADGSGRIVDVYGKKIGHGLRPTAEVHTHLGTQVSSDVAEFEQTVETRQDGDGA